MSKVSRARRVTRVTQDRKGLKVSKVSKVSKVRRARPERPATGLYFTGIPSSGVGIQLYISPGGDIQVKGVGSTGTYSVCGTITYPVD